MASVEVLVPFLDEEENRLRALGSAFECSSARASALEKAGLARECDASRVVRYGGQTTQAGGSAAKKKAEAAQEGAEQAEAAQEGADGAQPTRAELVRQAEALGISVPPKANKNRIAALIAKATGGETEE